MATEITLWAVAVLLVSLPAGWAFATFMRHDRRVNESFTTREDLLAHLDSGGISSPYVCWLLVAALGGAFVVAVALVAHWLQVVVGWAAG